MVCRVVVGHAAVVRAVRAAGSLMADLAAPLTAREPWLTAVLNTNAATGVPGRPAAVVVEPHPLARPDAVAALWMRRRGASTVVTVLGDGLPVPGGRPAARLLARSPAAAEQLADGITALLAGRRGPWTLRLAGLPLGDPTLAALAAGSPTAASRTRRSCRLVDRLADTEPGVRRTRDPAALERELPRLLAAEPDRRVRTFLRVAARLHAAIGRLEVARTATGGLLTLVDGDDRLAWWAVPGTAGLAAELGSPTAGLTAQGGIRLRRGPISPRTGAR